MNKIFILLSVTLMFACASDKKERQPTSSIISEATGITIDMNDNYTVVNIKNPWKEGSTLQSYILIPKSREIPQNLPKGTIIRTPLSNILVYSSVHAGIIKELGHLNSIKGVCDAEYFNMAEIQEGLALEKITNAGMSMSPSIEKIIELSPEAIILSPFQNAGYGTLTNLGIPIIECADYMESTPLGRAEWIKFFGLLFGEYQSADSIFLDTKEKYTKLKAMVPPTAKKPKVIQETLNSGIWYVPGGNSYMAHLFNDAGANYPWKDDTSTGTISLDFTQVFDKAHDADIWLLRSYGNDVTYKSLLDIHELNGQFAAYKNHNIYACNSAKTTLYEDFPFHPDILLREFICIFHPGTIKNYNLRYFKPLEE